MSYSCAARNARGRVVQLKLSSTRPETYATALAGANVNNLEIGSSEPAHFLVEYMMAPSSIKQRLARSLYKWLPGLGPGFIWLLESPA